MSARDIKEFDGLFSRLEDLKKRAVRGEMGISAFFSPRELHYAEAYLRSSGMGEAYFCYGGYSIAERKKIYILPEYMEGVTDASLLAEYGEESGILAVRIKGSGFASLSHRDFMGALLSLGIERSVIGDILVLDQSSALVFCESKIAGFIVSELNTVGRDKVRCSLTELEDDFCPKRSYAQISDTIASARLDCIVAALCNLSREKARECVVDGRVELDYEYCERPDKEVSPPCVMSVRGYGKFRICSVGEQTKKGRYRLYAEKFL